MEIPKHPTSGVPLVAARRRPQQRPGRTSRSERRMLTISTRVREVRTGGHHWRPAKTKRSAQDPSVRMSEGFKASAVRNPLIAPASAPPEDGGAAGVARLGLYVPGRACGCQASGRRLRCFRRRVRRSCCPARRRWARSMRSVCGSAASSYSSTSNGSASSSTRRASASRSCSAVARRRTFSRQRWALASASSTRRRYLNVPRTFRPREASAGRDAPTLVRVPSGLSFAHWLGMDAQV